MKNIRHFKSIEDIYIHIADECEYNSNLQLGQFISDFDHKDTGYIKRDKLFMILKQGFPNLFDGDIHWLLEEAKKKKQKKTRKHETQEDLIDAKTFIGEVNEYIRNPKNILELKSGIDPKYLNRIDPVSGRPSGLNPGGILNSTLGRTMEHEGLLYKGPPVTPKAKVCEALYKASLARGQSLKRYLDNYALYDGTISSSSF